MSNYEKKLVGLCEAFIPVNCTDDKSLMIIIGGSSGGLRSRDQAEFFASKGYPSAVIPYFALEGLPEELKHVPLEHFEDSIKGIRDLPEIGKRRCFVQGTSKGAEVSLLLSAKNIIDVDGIVLIAPTSHIWAAPVDGEKLSSGEETDKCSWSYKGQDVDFVRTDLSLNLMPKIENIEGVEYHRYTNFWYPQVKGSVGKIDLENLNTKLLVFSGKDDGLWPAYEFACDIENEMKKLGKEKLIEHISFENVGHNLPYPGKAPKIFSEHAELKIRIMYGGEEETVKKASVRYWEEVQKFIK